MRTAHLLTVSQHALPRGVSAQEGMGVCPGGRGWGGCICRGVCIEHAMGQTQPVDRQKLISSGGRRAIVVGKRSVRVLLECFLVSA